MDTQFNAYEVLELAKQIEKKGMNYYHTHAEITEEEEVKKLFLRLEQEEQKHYETFVNLENEIKSDKNKKFEYLNDPEVLGYLKILVEFSIFPAEISPEAAKNKSIDEIILTAIMAEKESILFYQELIGANKGESLSIIETLIKEEKQHLMDLSRVSQHY
ncbi:MAG: ferritin family protein [Halanaerobiaceae bacterium]